jgi:hypothetical protein
MTDDIYAHVADNKRYVGPCWQMTDDFYAPIFADDKWYLGPFWQMTDDFYAHFADNKWYLGPFWQMTDDFYADDRWSLCRQQMIFMQMTDDFYAHLADDRWFLCRWHMILMTDNRWFCNHFADNRWLCSHFADNRRFLCRWQMIFMMTGDFMAILQMTDDFYADDRWFLCPFCRQQMIFMQMADDFYDDRWFYGHFEDDNTWTILLGQLHRHKPWP